MTDRPILFSAPMVRAILEGRKTQTRRVLKPQPPEWVSRMYHEGRNGWLGTGDGHGILMSVPFAHGDRLWVREAWRADKGYDAYPPREMSHWPVFCVADGEPDPHDEVGENGRPRSPIHMPRWASRLTLIVEDVRVERLQDINLGDVYAEGCTTGKEDMDRGLLPQGWQGPWGEFRDLWDSLNGKRAPWDSNPWVVALTFRAIPANIDSAEAEP